MRNKIYIGCAREGCNLSFEIFRSKITPDATEFPQYFAAIGPFRTMRGARVMKHYGKNNPHLCCVRDAEKLAKLPSFKDDPLLKGVK